MKALVQDHQLEDALAAFVTAVIANVATSASPQLERRAIGWRFEARSFKDAFRVFNFLSAFGTNGADQPLAIEDSSCLHDNT